MTLTVTLKLSPEAEEKLRESIARKDSESARQVLAEAVAPTVENLLSNSEIEEPEQKSPDELSNEEFETLLDQLADEADRLIKPGTLPLPDYAFSRESFYENYPKL
jgi:antitoxin ParD1/3/4